MGKLTRRHLLKGLGAAAATVPFLKHATSAEAADTGKKLIVFFSPNSAMHRDHWTPGPDFALPQIFDDLAPYRDRLLTVGDIHMGPAPDDRKKGHNCMGMMLTGASLHYPNPDQQWVFTANHASVDQVVAQRFGVEALITGARIGNSSGTYRMSFTGPQAPVSPIEDPDRSFTRAFGDTVGMPDAAAEARAAQRRSVLDTSAGHIESLMPRLPQADRFKLEQHLDEVRALEQRLDRPMVLCDPTAAGSTLDADADQNYPEVARRQIDILVQALRCGVTRVGGLQLGSSGGAGTPNLWPGVDVVSSESEHDIAHAWRDGRTGDVLTDRIEVERFYTGLLKYLLDSLGSDLDDTLVLWVKSVGHNHAWDNVPFMLVGGDADGSYTPGRHVATGGRPNNDLLASVCQIMGLDDISTFGEAAYATGALSL